MLCIKNGTIVGPEGRIKADLYVADGRIAAVGGELPLTRAGTRRAACCFPAS